jgi:hypothetical protein
MRTRYKKERKKWEERHPQPRVCHLAQHTHLSRSSEPPSLVQNIYNSLGRAIFPTPLSAVLSSMHLSGVHSLVHLYCTFGNAYTSPNHLDSHIHLMHLHALGLRTCGLSQRKLYLDRIERSHVHATSHKHLMHLHALGLRTLSPRELSSRVKLL